MKQIRPAPHVIFNVMRMGFRRGRCDVAHEEYVTANKFYCTVRFKPDRDPFFFYAERNWVSLARLLFFRSSAFFSAQLSHYCQPNHTCEREAIFQRNGFKEICASTIRTFEYESHGTVIEWITDPPP